MSAVALSSSVVDSSKRQKLDLSPSSRAAQKTSGFFRRFEFVHLQNTATFLTLGELSATLQTCKWLKSCLSKEAIWKYKVVQLSIPISETGTCSYEHARSFILNKIANCLSRGLSTKITKLTYDDLLQRCEKRKHRLAKHLHLFSKEGLVACVKIILKSKYVKEAHRGLALLTASRGGHLNTVSIIMKSGSVSDENRAIALRNAAESGHIILIQPLLSSGDFSNKNLGHALCNASNFGHLAIVRTLLLSKPSQLEHAKAQARTFATRNGHGSIVHLLS